MRFCKSYFVWYIISALIKDIEAFTKTAPSWIPAKKSKAASLNAVANEVLGAVATAVDEGQRGQFFFWLVGASGGAGIARSAFPRMFKNTMSIQGLKGVGPTAGGEMLKISPLCGYPQDLSAADVQKIVNNRMSVGQMVEKGPKEKYFATKGYLVYEAFVQANPKCNPLALRAVFDSFNVSTDLVAPSVAQEKLDSYRTDSSGEIFKRELLLSKLKGSSAILALLFLLGLADVTAFNCASKGWFPDWPGNSQLPLSLIYPGIWTIKDYWVS